MTKKTYICLTAILATTISFVCLSSPVRSMLGAASIREVGEMPTAADYISDSLVAMWDGIENAGWKQHDDASSTWVDLSGNGYDMHLVADSSAYFDHNSLVTSSKNNKLSADTGTPLSWETIEVVADTTVSAGCMLFSGNQIDKRCFVRSGVSYLQFVDTYTEVMSDGSSLPIVGHFAGVYLGGYTVMGFCNGVPLVRGTGTNHWGANDRPGTVAVCGAGGPYAYASYNFKGKIHAIRLHSRKLTQEELLYNYLIDRERFGLP